DAAVTVSIVHLSHGRPGKYSDGAVLDAMRVRGINSRLRGGLERDDPLVLGANSARNFQGTVVLGMGFILTPERRQELLASSAKNAERIFPYLGGEDVNTSPSPRYHRYVISFGDLPLEEAERWPDLIEVVRREVKPERDKNNREAYRKYWWRAGEARPALYAAIRPLKRCLVNSQVSKHLVF